MPIGAGITLPLTCSTNILFMSGGGAADRTINNITSYVFIPHNVTMGTIPAVLNLMEFLFF